MSSRARQRLGLLLLPVVGSLTFGACTRANANGDAERGSSTSDQKQAGSARGDLRPLRQEELTDELMLVSERVLEQHADAPIGTEVPLRHRGRSYVARIEQHDNASNDPKRPPGKHKGVTLLTTEP